jgi:branched-chain amino acid transport system substrate-binding protein
MRTARIMLLGLGLLVYTFLGCIPTSTTAAELKPFSVGAFMPMTGLQAYYGHVMSIGAITALDEINAAGGVEGYKLNLIMTDFRDVSVDLAVSGVRKMISIDKTPYIFGSFSGCLLGAQPICADNHVVLVNGGGASPALANKPYLHNLRLHSGLVMPYGLEYMWKKGYRNLAVISYHEASGMAAKDDVVIPLWKKWGGKIVANESNEVTQIDISPQAARIKAANPDFIASLQGGELSGYAVKGLREMGLKCPILTNEWNPAAQKVAGEALSKDIFVSIDFFDRADPHPLAQRFVKNFEKRWKEEATFFSANYYDAGYLLAELIKRVVSKRGNPFDGAQLEAAIWDNPFFDSVYGGKMELLKDGTVRKTVVLFEVKGAKMDIIHRFKVE